MTNWKALDRILLKYLLLISLAVLAILKFDSLRMILSKIFWIASPLIFGGILAFILNLLMDKFEALFWPKSDLGWAHKIRRPLAILSSLLVIALAIFFILALIIPQLASVITEFSKVVPQLYQGLQDLLSHYEEYLPALGDYIRNNDFNWENISQRALAVANSFTSEMINRTLSTLTSMLSFVINFFLTLIFAIYILMSKETLGQQFIRLARAYLPDHFYHELMYILTVFNNSFANFISGEVVEAFILGGMVALGMWVFRFPYATMIGALTGFTALIPIVGAYLSAGMGFLLILVQSPLQAAAFLVFMVVVQQIEGNLIYPRVVGDSIGLPGIWVLASVTIGGGLGGVPGMLLGVPLASAFYQLVKTDVSLREVMVEENLSEKALAAVRIDGSDSKKARNEG